MKKVISTILALVMVLAVVATVPMTVSAATTYNTSRYFNNDSTTGLDAYAGTPTMGKADGATTIKEAVWDNAIKFTLNGSTNDFIIDNNSDNASDTDVYMLWDKDNLYILQDVRAYNKANDGKTDQKTTTSPFSYSGHEVNVFNILLPRDFSTAPSGKTGEEYYSNTDTAKSYMIFVMPALSNPDVTGKESGVVTGDIYEGVVRVRTNCFLTTTGNSGGKWIVPYQTSYDAGLRTWIEKTDAGYISETVIPWSFLDSTAGDQFANLSVAEKVGKTIGVKFNHRNTYVMNNYGMSVDGTFMNNDTAGYDPVTLYNTKETLVQNQTPSVDYDYWLNSTTGQFITKNPKNGGQTYEISTAGQLYALSEILETLAYNETTYGLNAVGLASNADKALLTRGNTFVLTNDIDLNPGVDCRNFEIAKYASLPRSFKGLDAFYGVFDGQGHTISGLMNLTDVANGKGNTSDFGGLIGRIGQGGIKNLVLDNGYVSDINGGGFGGVVGTIYTTSYTQTSDADGDYEIVLDNIYVGSNYYVRNAHKIKTANNAFSAYDGSTGGIFAAEWANNTVNGDNPAKTVDVKLNNVVFNGHIIKGGNNSAGLVGYRLGKTVSAGSPAVLITTYNLTVNDCIAYDNDNNGFKLFYSNMDSSYKFVRSEKVAKNAAIPEANAGYWVALNDGTAAPIKAADMFTDIKWQATAAENGKYAVRLVGELDSLNYNDAKFIVTLTGTKNGVTKTMTVDFTADKTPALAYSSLIANGQTVTADDVDFGMVEGDYFFVAVLNNLDTSVTYEVSAQAVYTLADGTVVTGVAQDLGQVAAWTNN